MNITDLFININTKEVLKNLPDAVLVVDFDGKILWVNDKSSIIFEAKSNELKGLYFNEIVANGIELAEKSFARRNSVVTGAFTIEGKEFFVEMNAKKYIDQYFITIRDITAMTNILANAEKTGRLNKEKNLMLVKLSNEFKSPVQSIIGFSQAILDGMGGNISDKLNKYVKIINKNSNDLLYFMNKFFDFAQAESSLFKYKRQAFDIINTIQTVVKNNYDELSTKGLVVNYNIEELNKRTFIGDENYIKIAFQNIIETSIKLTDVGSINIKIDNPDTEALDNSGIKALNDNYIRITISDTGIGLAEFELDGLFEPYTHLEKIHRKTVLRSISLGTAYNIIKRIGGSFDVHSEVMKGTKFTVILPAGNQQDE